MNRVSVTEMCKVCSRKQEANQCGQREEVSEEHCPELLSQVCCED